MIKKNKDKAKIKALQKIALCSLLAILLIFSLSLALIKNGYTFHDILYGKNPIGNLHNKVAVHIIDVGQGDCILIQTENMNMLIDSGTADCRDSLRKYLKSMGIKEIEYFVLTHSHADHVGSAAMILDEFNVKNIVYEDYMYEERLKAKFREENANIIDPERNDKFYLGDAEFTVLSSGGDYDDNVNNYSVVLKMEYKETSFIFTGDAEKEVEMDIIKNFPKEEIDVDFLKSGHHGSDTSSTEDFVKCLSPDIVAISCGKNNEYGHPSADVLKTFEKFRAICFRTDKHGTLIFVSDGEKIEKKEAA